MRAKGWARYSEDWSTLFLLSPFRSTLQSMCSFESTQYNLPLIRSGVKRKKKKQELNGKTKEGRTMGRKVESRQKSGMRWKIKLLYWWFFNRINWLLVLMVQTSQKKAALQFVYPFLSVKSHCPSQFKTLSISCKVFSSFPAPCSYCKYILRLHHFTRNNVTKQSDEWELFKTH